MWQCVFRSNYSDVVSMHAISRASSVRVNSHPAFDKKPGIKFVWPNGLLSLHMYNGRLVVVHVLEICGVV